MIDNIRSATKYFIHIAAFITALFIMTTFASAQNFGAIAFSQNTGVNGFSADYGSRAGAENRALSECYSRGGSNCIVGIWFANACGALAVGAGNGWGANWGNSRAIAENNALRVCRSNTGGCRVVRWVCTTR